MTKMRFLADADLNRDIVTGVLRRVPEIDFKTAQDAGLDGLPDDRVLEIAALENRILVTHDRRTMPFHFAEMIQTGNSAGVVVVSKKIELSRVIDDLILIWGAADAAEFINVIRYLPV